MMEPEEFRKRCQGIVPLQFCPYTRDCARIDLEALKRNTQFLVDFAREASVTSWVQKVEAEFGGIDIWANVAGILRVSNLVDLPEEEWDKVLDKILQQVPIKRLIEPEEVASLVIELYRNEALAGEVFYIHGGLRLGSRG